MTWFEIVGQVLIVLGGITFTTAGLGVLRFPDVYTRASAVSTAAGVGIVLVVFGALLIQPGIADLVKVVVIVLFQLATAAVGSIAIGRSAYLMGVPLARRAFDELEDAPPSD